jgi:hypothetical protein
MSGDSVQDVHVPPQGGKQGCVHYLTTQPDDLKVVT